MQLNQGNCLRRAGVVFAVLLGCLAFIARESVKADPPSKSDSPPPAQTPDPSAGARSLQVSESRHQNSSATPCS